MRIDKVEIDGFGKLNNVSFEFSDGVNLIYGENESGKSTLCEFVLASFYGLPNESKKTQDDITPRKKYRPWNTESFGGRLYFTDDSGKRLVIERSFKGTKRGDKAVLRDAATWAEIDNSDDLGVKIFGLSREAFLKTLYVKSFGADNLKTDDGELMSRLSNLETGADEDVSYSKIINSMEKEIYSLKTKTGRGGKISALEDKITSLNGELSISEMTYSSLRAEEEEAQKLKETAQKKEQEADGLTKKYELALAHERYKKDKKISETKAAIEEQLQNARKNLEELSLKEEQLDKDEGISVTAEEISRARELETKKLIAKDRVASLEKQQEENKSKLPLGIILGVLGIIGIVVGVFASYIAIIVGFVLVVCAGATIILDSKKAKENKVKAENFTQAQKELKYLESELDNIFKPYGVQISDELSAIFMNSKSKEDKKAELAKKRQGYITEIEALQRSIPDTLNEEEFSQEVMEYSGESAENIFARINTLKAESRQMQDHANDISIKVARKAAEIRNCADIKAELGMVISERDEAEKRYTALSRAARWLVMAHEEIKNNFAPRLNQKASEMLSHLTKNKYSDIRANDNFCINLKSTGGEIVEAGFMSRGTYDLLYIALRFASMSVLTEGNIPTVILDDAFSQLDDSRLLAAVDMVSVFDDFSQVLLFTCHENYKELLKNNNINTVSL